MNEAMPNNNKPNIQPLGEAEMFEAAEDAQVETFAIGSRHGDVHSFAHIGNQQASVNGEEMTLAILQRLGTHPKTNEPYQPMRLPLKAVREENKKNRAAEQSAAHLRSSEHVGRLLAAAEVQQPDPEVSETDAIDNAIFTPAVRAEVERAKSAMIDHVPGITRQEEPVPEGESQPEERKFWGNPSRVLGHPSNPTNGVGAALAAQEQARQEALKRMEE